jgi:ABC-type Fe3+-hydroxamate transport system substrate-binding protein
MIRIEHNVETGEITQIELTPEEIADVLARQEAAKPKVAAIEAEIAKYKADKESAQAKLAALGLTADDLKVLGL